MNELLESDRIAPTWLRLKEHLNERINELRAQNDNNTLTAEKTAAIRGRIAECKALLALENPAPVTEMNPVD